MGYGTVFIVFRLRAVVVPTVEDVVTVSRRGEVAIISRDVAVRE